MPQLLHVLYPRVTGSAPEAAGTLRPGSVAGDLFASPAFIPPNPGTPVNQTIRFSANLPGAGGLYDGNGPALCIHLRLLKLTRLGGDVAATAPLTAADVGPGASQVHVSVVLSTDNTFISTATDSAFQNPSAFTRDVSTASVAPYLAPGTFSYLYDCAVQFNATTGLFQIYIDPQTGWAASEFAGGGVYHLALVIRNGLGSELSAVFTIASCIVASNVPDTGLLSLPWLHVVPPAQITALSDTQAGVAQNFGTTWQDGTFAIGTGAAPLALIGASPNFAADNAGTVGVNFSCTNPATRLDPGVEMALTFHTTETPGTHTVQFTINGDTAVLATSGAATDDFHRRTIDVRATLGLVEILFVLDSSGSMQSQLGNDSIAAVGSRRWDYLMEGLEAIQNVMQNHGAGHKAAASIFPAGQTFALQAVDACLNAILAAVGPGTAFVPTGGTPMKQGLKDAFALVPASPATTDRRRLLLMTDGAWNTGGDPLQDASVLTSILSGSVRAAVVRLGNQSGVSGQTTLQTMASGTYGNPPLPSPAPFTVGAGSLAFVDPATAPSSVNTSVGQFNKSSNFVQTITEAVSTTILGLSSNADPGGVVSEQAPVATHEFTISECDRSATVQVAWITPDSERLDVILTTPLCETITATFEGPNFNFSSGPTHQQFHFGTDFLNGVGATGSRFGRWTITVALNEGSPQSPESPDFDGEGFEAYDFRVWSDSCIRFEASLEPQVTSTNSELNVTARLTASGLGVAGANISLILTRPTNSLAQFLADTPVSQALLDQVTSELAESGVVDPWEVKSVALQREGKAFVPQSEDVKLILDESDDSGTHAAALGSACIPGVYIFRVVAQGLGDSGVALRREVSFMTLLSPQIDAAHTTVTIELDTPTSGRVCWRPRDACDNPVLYNPALENPFTVTLQGGQLTGVPQAIQNGTYCQTATFNAGERPVVIITVPGNETPIITTTLPDIPNLIYCDKLLRHLPGVLESANQHNDPSAILGPFTSPTDPFLSLGAGTPLSDPLAKGQVVVAAQRASNPREVWVIVRPEDDPADLRPYSVELCTGVSQIPSPSGVDNAVWIEVGRSDGETKGFSLTSVGTKRVAAVRIRDRSLRASINGQFLATPGVSVFAVGFVADPLSPPITLDQCTVGATSAIQLKDRTQLLETGAPIGKFFNGGSGESFIGIDAKVGSVFSIGNVRAQNRALISGDIWTAGQYLPQSVPPNTDSPIVTGHVMTGVTSLSTPKLDGFLIPFPSGATVDVNVPSPPASGSTRVLSPGNYRNVTLAPNSKLVLSSSGKYFFETLFVDVGAKLDLTGTCNLVEVHVKQSFSYRGVVQTQTGKANFLLVTHGTGTTFIEAPFRGTIVSPKGSLQMQGSPAGSPQTKVHYGAFYAKNLTIEPDWKIIHVQRC